MPANPISDPSYQTNPLPANLERGIAYLKAELKTLPHQPGVYRMTNDQAIQALRRPLQIGRVSLRNRLILAPLAGVSDVFP